MEGVEAGACILVDLEIEVGNCRGLDSLLIQWIDAVKLIPKKHVTA